MDLEEKISVELGKKYFVNKIGWPLMALAFALLIAFLLGAWFEKMTGEQIALFIFGFLFLLLLGFAFLEYKNYERAKLHFIPEGVIISAKIGFIPLKYEDIKMFKSLNIEKSDGTKEFIIETYDQKQYLIKTKADIYDGLVSVFPDKDGSYLN